jgi:hypothetical protein
MCITTDAMENFLKFILYMYTEKRDVLVGLWKKNKHEKKAGGYSDMEALLYWKSQGQQIADLACMGYDHNINAVAAIEDNFDVGKYLKSIKKIRFINGKAYMFRNGKKVEMKT